MTALTLSPRDRRTLLIGVGVVASLLFLSRGLPALIRWRRSIREDAASALAEAAASQRTVQLAPRLAYTARQLQQRYFALMPAFINGEHQAAAGAALISMVNGAAQTAGMQLGALQVETDTSAEGEVKPVRVRGDGAGDIAGVMHFLSDIEGGVPLLSIRGLSIASADPRVTSDKPETIRVSFVIEGLARYDNDAEQEPHAGVRK